LIGKGVFIREEGKGMRGGHLNERIQCYVNAQLLVYREWGYLL